MKIDHYKVLEEALYETFGDRTLDLTDLSERLLVFAEKSKVNKALRNVRDSKAAIAILTRLLKKHTNIFIGGGC